MHGALLLARKCGDVGCETGVAPAPGPHGGASPDDLFTSARWCRLRCPQACGSRSTATGSFRADPQSPQRRLLAALTQQRRAAPTAADLSVADPSLTGRGTLQDKQGPDLVVRAGDQGRWLIRAGGKSRAPQHARSLPIDDDVEVAAGDLRDQRAVGIPVARRTHTAGRCRPALPPGPLSTACPRRREDDDEKRRADTHRRDARSRARKPPVASSSTACAHQISCVAQAVFSRASVDSQPRQRRGGHAACYDVAALVATSPAG